MNRGIHNFSALCHSLVSYHFFDSKVLARHKHVTTGQHANTTSSTSWCHPLPPAPQDPPVLADVVRAKYYERRVETALGRLQIPNGPTSNDDARADIYKTQVILAHSADNAAPPWFGPALNAGLNAALTQHLTPIKMTLAKVSALHNP